MGGIAKKVLVIYHLHINKLVCRKVVTDILAHMEQSLGGVGLQRYEYAGPLCGEKTTGSQDYTF